MTMTESFDAVLAETKHPKFGDWVRGNFASENNPIRDGMFVRVVRRSGRMNPGVFYELTDGKGKFWQFLAKETTRLPDRLAAAHAAEVAKCAEAIPTNWCDPLLTGPDAVLRGKGGTWGCPDIERLLSSIRNRIAALTNQEPPHDH